MNNMKTAFVGYLLLKSLELVLSMCQGFSLGIGDTGDFVFNVLRYSSNKSLREKRRGKI